MLSLFLIPSLSSRDLGNTFLGKKWEVLEKDYFTLVTITKSYFYHGYSKESLNDWYMEIVIVIFVDSPQRKKYPKGKYFMSGLLHLTEDVWIVLTFLLPLMTF